MDSAWTFVFCGAHFSVGLRLAHLVTADFDVARDVLNVSMPSLLEMTTCRSIGQGNTVEASLYSSSIATTGRKDRCY